MNWLRFKNKYEPKYSLINNKSKNLELKEKTLYEYVRDSWYVSRFNKWMIYHTPPGWANTRRSKLNKQIIKQMIKNKLKSIPLF